MLNLIRDNVQSFGIKFIVFIVVLVMAFFGISTFQNQSSNTMVTVDGYDVKIDRYQRAFENARDQAKTKYGSQASQYLKMINLEAQVLNQLTSSALLLKSAELNGLAVSDKELATEIYHTPAFLTDNRFDQSKYVQQLTNMRVEKLGYEKDLKENLMTRKYFQFISTGALFSRDSLKEEYSRYDSEMEIKVIDFDPSLFADQAQVSDQEISGYYDTHKSDFQQKNQFAIKYFELNAEDEKGKVTVREKAVAKYYENNKETEFATKESFLSRHILIATPKDKNVEGLEAAKNKADSVYRQLLKDQGQFASLAKQSSDDPGSAAKGGELGWVEKGSFVSEFENAVASLKKNEISKPFLSDFGYHIVELLDRKPILVQEFEEVKADIEENIRINMAKRRLSNQVDKLLADLKTIDELAQSLNKPVVETGIFDDTQNLDKIGYSYQLYQALKGKSLGNKGQHNLAGDKRIILYEVIKTTEPFVKPLAEVKEQVRSFALTEKKKNLAKEKLNEYAAVTKTLKEFDGLAQKLKTKAITTKFKFSDRQIEKLSVSNRFKVEAFKLSQNKVKAILDNDRGYLVYMLDKKKGVLNDDNGETLTVLENMMKRQKAEIVLNGFINQLRREVEIDYNTPLLEAMNVRLDS